MDPAHVLHEHCEAVQPATVYDVEEPLVRGDGNSDSVILHGLCDKH